MFRSVDRVKLVLSIIKADPNENGAGLVLQKLLKNGIIVGAYPLHDVNELRAVQDRWLNYWAWPWNQPFGRIKDYFGEKIGLYFLFLGHYTGSVMVAAAVGLVFWVMTVVQGPNSPAIPVFCVFMSVRRPRADSRERVPRPPPARAPRVCHRGRAATLPRTLQLATVDVRRSGRRYF